MRQARRTFLWRSTLAMASAGVPRFLANRSLDPDPFILSQRGCGRATGYAEANKIISANNKTHVAWLDSLNDGFSVRVRSFDHQTSTWSPLVVIGDGHDNHGGPSLTIDGEGFLHIVYFPHHHAMRYRRSTRPFDASEWTTETYFGERLTYPTLVCGPDDTLYCSCRRSYIDQPWEVELWKKTREGDWQFVSRVLRSRHHGYAHFQESLCWSKVDHSLHLACRVHEKSDEKAYGRLQAVAYLQSSDFGRSWKSLDGNTVQATATVDDLSPLVLGGLDMGKILRCGQMGVNRKGDPFLVYSQEIEGFGETFLAKPKVEGGWNQILLNTFLPANYKGWSMIMPGGLVFDQDDQLYIVAQIHQAGQEQSWGHPSNEIVVLKSRDHGTTFESTLISRQDIATSHWLPSIERPTGHNHFIGGPTIAFTSGKPGAGNSDILSNEVCVVMNGI
ncbi:MAG: hypothetical protein HKN87_20905 [Saprospiraceae bacterium]|nr:hypothetical protein [Saprospiraceae bacterium]